MNRYILTGAPGAGKTMLIRQLERQNFSVGEEAATDVIALEQAMGNLEPWSEPRFVESILELQLRRIDAAAGSDSAVQFHDRSIFCTCALARFLQFPIPAALDLAVRQAVDQNTYQRRVFFVQSLGFIAPTEARRINLADALRFERVHEDIYQEFGFELYRVVPAPIPNRVASILEAIRATN